MFVLTHIARILTSLGQLGFTRYKKPFIVALERVVKDAVPNARRSLQDYWKATLDYDTENYRRETLEIPEDREPSVFFATLESAQAPLPAVVIATAAAAAAVETNPPEPDNHSCDENLLPPVQTDECKESEDVPKASDNCVSVQQEESKPNVDVIAKPKNEPENEPENEGEESNTEKNDNENKDKDCEDERQQQ